MKALDCLRKELIVATKETEKYGGSENTPEKIKKKIKDLSSLIMCKDLQALQKATKWDGAEGKSRENLLKTLQSYISPQKMLESGRLESLLKQSLKFQISTCKFHDWDKKDHDYSLLEQHKCEKTPLPNKLLCSITTHKDEVWYVAISPDGTKLASVSKDKVMNIWNLVPFTNGIELVLHNRIKKAHNTNDTDINSVMWNSSSDKILTCSEKSKIFDVNTGD